MKIVFIILMFFNFLFADYFSEGIIEYRIGDKTKALKLLMQSCKKENQSKCYDIGSLFLEGEVIKQNLTYAKEFYKRGCYFDDYSSCFYVGYLFLKDKDHPNALRYLKYACENDISDACSMASAIYDRTYKDDKNFIKYLKKACNKNNYHACSQLGIIFYRGNNSIDEDKKRAYDFFSEACFNGQRDESCLMVAHYNQTGNIIGKDLNLAKKIYEDLCDKNYKDGCEQLHKLEISLQ